MKKIASIGASYLQAFGLQVKDKREPIGDFQICNILLGDFAQMHQEPTDRILAAGNQHSLARFNGVWRDALREERNGPIHTILQRLTFWEFSVERYFSSLNAANHGFSNGSSGIIEVLYIPTIISWIMW